MQKVTKNYLSKVTRYFYFVTEQHCWYKHLRSRTDTRLQWRNRRLLSLTLCEDEFALSASSEIDDAEDVGCSELFEVRNSVRQLKQLPVGFHVKEHELLGVTVSELSCNVGTRQPNNETLCFVPAQSSSVLAGIICRRFAAIQWLMSTTHWLRWLRW